MRIKRLLAAAFLLGALSGGALQAAAPAELTADTLEYDAETGLVEAKGSVRITQDGAVATGQTASYNTRTKESYLSGGVEVVKESMRMNAATVRALVGATQIVAEGDVVAVKDDWVLTAPRVEYDTERQYAELPSAGRVETADGTVTADRMEAYLGEERVNAFGNVHIVSPPRNLEAFSDNATYDKNERGKLVLSGNAVATQDGNTLRGKTLTLYLGEQR